MDQSASLLSLTSRPTRGQKRRLLIPDDFDPNEAFLNSPGVPSYLRGYYIVRERHRKDLNREEPTGDANDDVVEAAEEDQELQQTPQAVAIGETVNDGEDERDHDVNLLAIQEAMPEIHPPIPENLENVINDFFTLHCFSF
ncbi:unnamed protein product [Caenorhabditis nigoni]